MPTIERCVVCNEDDGEIMRQCPTCYEWTCKGTCADEHQASHEERAWSGGGEANMTDEQRAEYEQVQRDWGPDPWRWMKDLFGYE